MTSLSTHVLDTGAGSPANGVLVVLYRGDMFVVFVDGRTRAELLPVLRERLRRTREEELETGLRELCAIARNRWTRSI